MKLIAGLLVLCCVAISSTLALPARNPDDDAEFVRVPLQKDTKADEFPSSFDGVVDTGSGYPFLSPVPHNFGVSMGFFDSFEDILKRFRSRLWPAVSESGDSEEVGFPSLGLQPPKGGNTTSVVKVVNGHKVEINNTVYSKGDNNDGVIFKVRVINIRPLESDEDAGVESTAGPSSDVDASTPDKGSPEILDKSFSTDNEINANVDDPETTTLHPSTDYPQSTDSTVESNPTTPLDTDPESGTTEEGIIEATTEVPIDEEEVANSSAMEDALPIEGVASHNDDNQSNPESDSDESESETVAGNGGEWEPSAKLTQNEQNDDVDTTTTTVPTDDTRRRHPLQEEFSEEFPNENGPQHHAAAQPIGNSEWDTVEEEEDDNNSLDNDIDAYDHLPIDLSNDIHVNDIQADQGAPFEPEAEIFSVDEFVPEGDGYRKPAKLSRFEAIEK